MSSVVTNDRLGKVTYMLCKLTVGFAFYRGGAAVQVHDLPYFLAIVMVLNQLYGVFPSL